MSKLPTIVFASENTGKIREMNDLLMPLGWSVKSQREFDIESLPETAVTFVENALVKARHAAELSGQAAIADDSGLEVDALQGAPGLFSSRYAAKHHQGEGDVANYELLLRHLKDVPEGKRTARFRSVLVYLRHAADPAPVIAEGVWHGSILLAPVGTGGFGYDPVFQNADTHISAALLDNETKNKLSHRGKAVRSLIQKMSGMADAAPRVS